MTIRTFGKETAKYAGCFCPACFASLEQSKRTQFVRTILPRIPFGQGATDEISLLAKEHDAAKPTHEIIVWRFDDMHPIDVRIVRMLKKYKVPVAHVDFSRNTYET
ncbi:MAG: hypothetical protein ACOY3M_03965 [Patescibacteria group bacterium]